MIFIYKFTAISFCIYVRRVTHNNIFWFSCIPFKKLQRGWASVVTIRNWGNRGWISFSNTLTGQHKYKEEDVNKLEESIGISGLSGNEELISSKEVARILEISVSTVIKWSRNGILTPVVITPTNRRHFKKSDIDEV